MGLSEGQSILVPQTIQFSSTIAPTLHGVRMSDGLTPPPPFAAHDSGADWEKWLGQFNCYMTATEKDKKDEKIQIATLLTLLGSEALDAYRNFKFDPATDKEKIKVVKEKFTTLYAPRRNTTYERYRFMTTRQSEGELFDTFLASLMARRRTCRYDASEADNITRDQIVIGIRSAALREQLLAVDGLTLDKATSMCRSKETAANYAKVMSNNASNNTSSPVSSHVDVVRGSSSTGSGRKCGNCGSSHAPRQCPAYGKQCSACTSYGHFAKCCRKTARVRATRSDNGAHHLHVVSAPQGSLTQQAQCLAQPPPQVAYSTTDSSDIGASL